MNFISCHHCKKRCVKNVFILIAAALIDFPLLNLLLVVFQGSRTVWGSVSPSSPENLTSLNIKVLLNFINCTYFCSCHSSLTKTKGATPKDAWALSCAPCGEGTWAMASAHLRSFPSPSIVPVHSTPCQEFYPEPLSLLSCSLSLEEASEFILQSFDLSVSVLKSCGMNIISQE